MKADVFALLALLFASFIVIPYVPHESYYVLDYALVRIILLLIMVYSLRYGPVIGVATFLLVSALLLERNYRILSYSKLLFKYRRRGEAPRMEGDEDMPVSGEVYYVPDEVPEETDIEYRPYDELGSNDYTAEPGSDDNKVVMNSAPLGTAAAGIFQPI